MAVIAAEPRHRAPDRLGIPCSSVRESDRGAPIRADIFPDQLVVSGDLENPAIRSFRDQRIAIRQTLGAADKRAVKA